MAIVMSAFRKNHLPDKEKHSTVKLLSEAAKLFQKTLLNTFSIKSTI